MERSILALDNFDMPAIGKFIREKSLKVIESLKELGKVELKGRISFFSRSTCTDCTAVRSFFREKNLNIVEINIDVYPTREKELIERTDSGTVPQIFFNEKLIGGLVVLNSLRNSGMLEKKIEEMLGIKCLDDVPEPLYTASMRRRRRV
ncbi:glutaredoxin-related [Abeliophyllum distichum]|uniref:Glutaredoxin-related n=1 Tax=Abeliophyllum distichum TaxID=126358 RepID=A0ABD1PP24_9LAMI